MMEITSNSYAGYQPLNLAQIQIHPAVLSDRDLEAEISKICETLKDTQSYDWKKRTESLKRVQEISALFPQIMEGASNVNPSFYVQQIQKLYAPLTAQVLDLRSASAKEAGKAIMIMAQSMRNDFESIAYKFISKDSLMKLLHSGNKVLAEIGNQTIIAIIHNVFAPKIILRFQEEMKGSKNTWVHAKCALYLYLILEIYPYEAIFERGSGLTTNLIEQYLQQSLTDANSEARQNGRRAFLAWQKRSPQAADNLFRILDYAVQRAIYEEKESFDYSQISSSTTTTQMTSAKSIPVGGGGSVFAQPPSLQQKAQSFKSKQQQIQIHQEEGNSFPVGVRTASQQRPQTATQKSFGINEKKNSQLNLQNLKTPTKNSKPPHSPIVNNFKALQSKTIDNSCNEVAIQSQKHPQQQQQQQYMNPFTEGFNKMDIDQQTNYKLEPEEEKFCLDKVFIKLKAQHWQVKAQALEQLMRHLVDLSQEELLQYQEEEKVFPLIVSHSLKILESENVFRVLEVGLDLVEFLLTQIPESLFNFLEEMIFSLLKLVQNKKESINSKANEVLNLAQEILSADVMLPHLVSLMTNIQSEAVLLSTKISALEVLNILIKSSENLNEMVQFESIVSVVGTILQQHSTQKSIQMPSLGAILALRDKDLEKTLRAIIEQLPQNQYNIVKQLANAYERSFARQIVEANSNLQQQTRQSQMASPSNCLDGADRSYQQQPLVQQQSLIELIKQNSTPVQVPASPSDVFSNKTNKRPQSSSQSNQPSLQAATPGGAVGPLNKIQATPPMAVFQNKENHQCKQHQKPQITTLSQFTPSMTIASLSQSSTTVTANQTTNVAKDLSAYMDNISLSSVNAGYSQQPTLQVSNPFQSQPAQFTPTSAQHASMQQYSLAQEIINNYQILMQQTAPSGSNSSKSSNPNGKVSAMKNLVKLSKLQSSDDSWNATLESVLDTLLSVLGNQSEPASFKEAAFSTLTDIIKSQPRERFQQFSKKLANCQLREKVFSTILNLYVPTLPMNYQGTQQCQSNQSAEELLEELLLKSEMSFVSRVVGLSLRNEVSPKLQALLKVLTTRIKAVNSGQIQGEFKYETYHQIVDSLLSQADILTEAINNQNADVRKCCVFCLVEIQGVIGDELFLSHFIDKLNPSQQKLVDIYIKRKQDLLKQQQQQQLGKQQPMRGVLEGQQ